MHKEVGSRWKLHLQPVQRFPHNPPLSPSEAFCHQPCFKFCDLTVSAIFDSEDSLFPTIFFKDGSEESFVIPILAKVFISYTTASFHFGSLISCLQSERIGKEDKDEEKPLKEGKKFI